MRKKRLTKRQRRIRAYIARAIAAIIIFSMLFLMFCGCLYIRDFFKKGNDKDKGNNHKVESQDKDNDKDSDKTNEENEGNEDEDSQDAIATPPKYGAFHVVLDAGHGGYDGGTLNGDILEKDINLSITLKVAELLKAEGVAITFTREKDEFISLEKRVSIANQTTANFFVSLHCNFFEGDSTVDGFEVYYVKNSEGSQKYAESIAAEAQLNSNIVVRGAKENAYYVTRNTSMDAVLIEMGFLSNTTECQKLANDTYQSEIAQAIANGIFKQFDAQLGTSSDSTN